MSRSVSQRRSSRSTLIVGAFVVFLISLSIGIAVTRPKTGAAMPPPEQAAVPHFVDPKALGDPRTVVVGGMTDSLPGTSNAAGYLMTNLRSGQIPEGATSAVVLTDTNCAPDADGISHCLNDLQIGNVIVTVQHHHAMAEISCLSPGETVTLMSIDEYRAQL